MRSRAIPKLVRRPSGPAQPAQPAYALTSGFCLIGRSPESHVVVDDPSASKFHAEVTLNDGLLLVRDLGSANGTQVNDQPIRRRSLHEGDIITIGETHFVVRWESDDPPAMPSSRTVLDSGLQPSSAPLAGSEQVHTRARFQFDPQVSGEELEAAYERLLAVFEALRAMSWAADLGTLCGRALHTAMTSVGADTGHLLLRGDDGELTEEARSPGSIDHGSVSYTIVQTVLDGRESVIASDPHRDVRLEDISSVSIRARSLTCVPITHGERCLGVIYLTANRPEAFDARDLGLLSGLGVGAGLAIANAQMVRRGVEQERLAAVGLAVTGVAYHLENTLGILMDSLQLVRQGIETDDPALARTLLPILERGAQRVDRSVREVLAFGEGSGSDRTEGSINDLVSEVAEHAQSRAKEDGIDVQIELDASVGTASLDVVRFHDLLIDLMVNALDAVDQMPPQRRRVRVRTRRLNPDRIAVEVEDHGPGIEPELRERIFWPFFTTKHSQGTGLGLAIARKVAIEHDGTLELDTSFTDGTRFVLQLPCRGGPR